jgi:hypothetical protein
MYLNEQNAPALVFNSEYLSYFALLLHSIMQPEDKFQ